MQAFFLFLFWKERCNLLLILSDPTQPIMGSITERAMRRCILERHFMIIIHRDQTVYPL